MHTTKEEYKNVSYFLLSLVALIIAGFYKSYFGMFPYFDNSILPITHVHAVAMSLYVCLLVMQPLLIRYKKYKAHRLLGKVSYILVPIIVFSFFLMSYKKYNDKLVHKISATDYTEYIFLNAAKLLLFAGFYLLAISNKRNTARHMRYIIATALVFVEPAFSRATFFWLNMDFVPSMLYSFVLTD